MILAHQWAAMLWWACAYAQTHQSIAARIHKVWIYMKAERVFIKFICLDVISTEISCSSGGLELRSSDREFEPQWNHSGASLSKPFYPLLSTGSITKFSRHDWKTVDWDVKHQYKQTSKPAIKHHEKETQKMGELRRQILYLPVSAKTIQAKIDKLDPHSASRQPNHKEHIP